MIYRLAADAAPVAGDTGETSAVEEDVATSPERITPAEAVRQEDARKVLMAQQSTGISAEVDSLYRAERQLARSIVSDISFIGKLNSKRRSEPVISNSVWVLR